MMSRFSPICTILNFCCFFLLSAIVAGQLPAAFSAPMPAETTDISTNADPFYLSASSNIPAGVLDLMKAARAKYIEGSALIKTGDSDKAQKAFNKAVDLVLQSSWDLPSTPVLNRFFQDLIQRIQQDESCYLLVPFEASEEMENAIVDELGNLDLVPITIDPDLKDVLTLDLAKNKYEIPITINEMVLKSLNFWMNRGRKVFEDGLIRSGQYRPIIEKIFREESVPLDLMYLAQVESLFRPHAVSKAKAKGIWQFEKGTAIRYGLKVTRDIDERSDPEKSTRAAARYLSDLFAMFKDWNLALAAYNWGEGKVQRLISSTGMTDFWKLVDLRRRLPAETKKHIPLIQASVILGRNPEKYGFPTDLDPPLQYTEVSVSKPIDLRAAAKVLSTSIEELKKLNPSLRGLTTPANYPNFQLKIPLDSAPEDQEKLAALPAAKISPLLSADCRHRVRSGETLTGIAARYHVKLSELLKANNISPKKILRIGTRLRLPSCSEENASKASSKSASSKMSAKTTAPKPRIKKAGTSGIKAVSSKAVSAANPGTKASRSKSTAASLNRSVQTKSALKEIAAK
jgi:membrane-bound lytic murein transglycosylase D